jgi:hypothetical protein
LIDHGTTCHSPLESWRLPEWETHSSRLTIVTWMLYWTSQRSSSWGHLRNVWVGSRSSLSSWIELITLIKLLMRLNTLRLHLMIVKLLLLWILRLHIKLVVFAYRCLGRPLELLSMGMHHSSKTRYVRRNLRTIVYLVWRRLNVLVDLI